MPVMRAPASALPAVVAAALALAAGCASDTPETRVRKAIARAGQAVEDRAILRLRDRVSDAYADDAGNDKRAVVGLVHLQMRRHEAIHLLVRTRDIAFPEERRATATVLVAMAGHEIDSLAALTGVSADLFRFDIVLVEEDGDWRLVSAAWRRAVREDFL
jgi:hypothetical protein